LADGIDPRTATIVTSVVGEPSERRLSESQEPTTARWLPEAPDCSPGEVEIRTFYYRPQPAHPNLSEAVPNGEISFSFVIP
jgi:hypothetical protein